MINDNPALPRLHSKRAPWAVLICWLIPVVFIAGYLATFNIFEDMSFKYLSLTMASIFACCLLLSRLLNRPLQSTLPIWVIFGVFILAYYLKFYWLVFFPELGLGMHPLFASLFYSTFALISSYATTTYAFGSFCIVSWFLIGKPKAEHSREESGVGGKKEDVGRKIINYRFVIFATLLIVVCLMLVTGYITYITGISVMSAAPVYLPFRLAGIIFYTRTVFIPALLLLLVWCGMRSERYIWTNIGLTLLLIHGLSDMVLRSSRGGLAGVLLALGFLFW
jgi:hypothetical protein